jgi:5-methylcytosine-specific restriction protein B
MNPQSALITALATKPFAILTGNSGTGKTRMAEMLAEWLGGANQDRRAIVAVGADWTDNRNVIGFVNYLRESTQAGETESVPIPVYQSTPILDLVLAATNELSHPYFLILDEMNLSHVERYFADFLSAMESKDGKLLLHRENTNLPRIQNGLLDVPRSVTIPPNLFVVGTVNVDETTYMFSPKVLDRAHVIEFRTSKDAVATFFESSGEGLCDIEIGSPEHVQVFLRTSYSARAINDAPPLTLNSLFQTAEAPLGEKIAYVKSTLEDLFAILAKQHAEFGYRTIVEFVRFVAVDYELIENKETWDVTDVVDTEILQKILPKLHGSKRRIGNLLVALASYCETQDKDAALAYFASETQGESFQPNHGNPKLRQSYAKLRELIIAMRRDQFVTFIQ